MIRRGDVVLVDFPFTTGGQSKVRPALVVQNDLDNARLPKTILAMMTGNLRRAAEPTHLLIDPATPDGRSSGLHGASCVVCGNLYTVEQSDILRTIGHGSAMVLSQINDCLRAALEIS